MISLLEEVMERGREEAEGPSEAGDMLGAGAELCGGQEKQHRRAQRCPSGTAGVREHTGQSRVCHGVFPATGEAVKKPFPIP